MTDIQARWDIGLLNDQCQIPKSLFDKALFSFENKVFTFYYSMGYSFKVSGVISSISESSSEFDDLIEFCVTWKAYSPPPNII